MINTHILKKIIVTEKALRHAEVYDVQEGNEQVVTFRVDTKATKPQIKSLIESVYNVKVKSVNTLNQQGKTKYFRQRPGRRADFKKAYVTLEKGHKIDVEVFGQNMTDAGKEAGNA